jgi:hypothetical protein
VSSTTTTEVTDDIIPLDTPFIEFTCDTVGCEQTELEYVTDTAEGETYALCRHCKKEMWGVSS